MRALEIAGEPSSRLRGYPHNEKGWEVQPKEPDDE